MNTLCICNNFTISGQCIHTITHIFILGSRGLFLLIHRDTIEKDLALIINWRIIDWEVFFRSFVSSLLFHFPAVLPHNALSLTYLFSVVWHYIKNKPTEINDQDVTARLFWICDLCLTASLWIFKPDILTVKPPNKIWKKTKPKPRTPNQTPNQTKTQLLHKSKSG